ncbi:hypothetical protein BHE74_00002798 [Ensete ventricosum]|nr:hypothetical protein BHE74_00002798 [Ensete ventricosum]
MDKQDGRQRRFGLEEEVRSDCQLLVMYKLSIVFGLARMRNGVIELQVAVLQDELEKEQKLNQILECALHGPFMNRQVQVLLAELAMVEEEIITLERKIEDLKMCIYQERKQKKERSFRPAQQHQWSSHCKTSSTSSSKDTSQKLDLCGVPPEGDGTGRDMGSNQKLVNVTQASLDMSRISLCIPTIGKLR